MSHLSPAFRAAGGAASDADDGYGVTSPRAVVDADMRTDLRLWLYLGGRWDREVTRAVAAADAIKATGNQYFSADKLEEAIDAYSEGLSLLPNDKAFDEQRAVLYGNRAACYVQQGAFASTVDDCNYALGLKPKYVKVLMRRATALEKLDRLDEALSDWSAVVKEEPKNTTAAGAMTRVQTLVNERNEKLKTEMLDKLKGLGNMVLGKFGLSLDNFKMQQDPNTGSYSINFQQ